MKHTLLAIMAIAALSGCAAAPKKQPAGLAARSALTATRSSVQSVRVATAAVATSTTAARANVDSARVSSDVVAKSFVELRSAIDALEASSTKGNIEVARAKLAERQADQANQALQQHLDSARVSMTLAVEQAQVADQRAEQADLRAQQADAATDRLIQEDAQKAIALEQLQRDHAKQRLLAWKWRLIAAGIAIAIVSFFVLRQYFPFLKFL